MATTRSVAGRVRMRRLLAALGLATSLWPAGAGAAGSAAQQVDVRAADDGVLARLAEALASTAVPIPVEAALPPAIASPASLLEGGPALTERPVAAAKRAPRSGAHRAEHRRLQVSVPRPVNRPAAMLLAIGTAQSMGMRVTQNPAVGDPMRGGHVGGSKHYQRFAGTNVGRAIDVYGTPDQLERFFRWAEENREAIYLDDLFFDPIGSSYDAGQRWPVTVGGHSDHVHLSI